MSESNEPTKLNNVTIEGLDDHTFTKDETRQFFEVAKSNKLFSRMLIPQWLINEDPEKWLSDEELYDKEKLGFQKALENARNDKEKELIKSEFKDKCRKSKKMRKFLNRKARESKRKSQV